MGLGWWLQHGVSMVPWFWGTAGWDAGFSWIFSWIFGWFPEILVACAALRNLNLLHNVSRVSWVSPKWWRPMWFWHCLTCWTRWNMSTVRYFLISHCVWNHLFVFFCRLFFKYEVILNDFTLIFAYRNWPKTKSSVDRFHGGPRDLAAQLEPASGFHGKVVAVTWWFLLSWKAEMSHSSSFCGGFFLVYPWLPC